VKNPISLIPRGSVLEQVEMEDLRGNWVTLVHPEKRPLNGSRVALVVVVMKASLHLQTVWSEIMLQQCCGIVKCQQVESCRWRKLQHRVHVKAGHCGSKGQPSVDHQMIVEWIHWQSSV